MRREVPNKIAALIIGLTIVIAGGAVWALAGSFRADGGVRFKASATCGTAGTASNPVTCADNTTQPNLRFDDGTAVRYVPACTPTMNGDICSWNGANWVRGASSGVTWPLQNGTSTDTFLYGGTMTGTSIAYSYDTTNAYTVGDKITFKSGGTEFLKLTQNFSGIWDIQSANANIGLLNSSSTGIRAQGAGILLGYVSATAYTELQAGIYSPNTDGQTQLGGSGQRWLGLWNKGRFSASYNTQSGTTYTIVAEDHYVGMSSSSARTVTLVAANGVPAGWQGWVKDENGNAATNNVTVQRAGSDTIDGATSTVINTNFGRRLFESDGVSKWFILVSQ